MIKRRNGRLRIAVQSNGRLTRESTSLLRHAGLEFEEHDRRLLAPCRNFDLDILFVRDDDVPEYVQDAVVDLGIVGANIVRESGARVEVLQELGFGYCSLVLAVPQSSAIQSPQELAGLRIATSYPRSLRGYLDDNGIEAEIIEISGGAEVAPALDVCEAICDLTSTGSTLRVNDLRRLTTLHESQAVLIGNADALQDDRYAPQIRRLITRMDSYLTARRLRYVMLNAPASALDRIRDVLPGLRSPTVIPLADREMVAVHAAVDEEVFWDVLEKLKEAGGSDILVLPVEKLMR
ncbi:MAG: ATP phosphoribosyltransferase [Gemmatimonadales bacterium]|jgi:ATP phosphoribosyltransferase